MWSFWLFACTGASDLRTPLIRDTDPSEEADTDTDSDADFDADSDADADTDADSDSDADSEVCWLGPDRNHRVCVPTVPYSAAFGDEYDYPAPYQGSPQYAAPDRYVDLDAVAADLAIAPNFQLDEYMRAEKGQWGVLQTHTLDKFQAIRDDIGTSLIITSGYRNPDYNAGVGGVEYSRHQWGDAADLDASGFSVEDLGDVCAAFDASYVGLYEDGHTHCDWRDDPLDPAFYNGERARRTDDYPLTTAIIVPVAARFTAPATGFDEGEPLREWTAFSAEGRVLTTFVGREFEPPSGTARVGVWVGGNSWAELAVAPSGG